MPEQNLSLFDPDSPHTVPELWQAQMKEKEEAADRDGIPHVDIKERRKNMGEAIALLAKISRHNGLAKMTTSPRMAEIHDERASHYREGVFDVHIVPGAKSNRSKLINELEPTLDSVFGDVEGARESAWADFTPAERAELELSPDQPDREELSIAFRAKYMRKEGAKARERQRRKLTQKPKHRAA